MESFPPEYDIYELSYFQNYLHGLIPPDLFDLFLFDGEEIGNMFSTNLYNKYIENATYTLCGLDLFQIIRKYTWHYVGKAMNADERKLHKEYEQLRKRIDALEEKCIKFKEEIYTCKENLELVETQLIELETVFKNAGGITEAERKELTKEFEQAENIKTESLTKIKIFVDGLMPFYIVRDFANKISNQLDYEEKGEIFYYVQQKLNGDEIKKTFSGDSIISDDTIDHLLEVLIEKFKPQGFSEDAQPKYDLSKEEIGRVNAMISAIDDFDSSDMITIINRRRKAATRTAEINRILKNAMTDEDAVGFAKKENELLRKREELTRKLYEAQAEYEALQAEINTLEPQRDKALQNLKDGVQNKHVIDLSTGLTSMMETMLTDKTIMIKKKLESLTVEKLHRIYRKNNLITHIEIEEDFQFNLYQDAIYNVTDLLHLMRNLGKEPFGVTIGRQGQQKLFELFGVDTLNQLQQVLSFESASKQIELYKKIDLNRLSKGERQIFILALYWAIIELSKQDIPFIIDTPYARIDANHRREISENLFPNISNQVIILSTDEEINEKYYKIIKPYIAKEYLLVNDENQNKTSIEQHYFFEV